MEKNSLLLLMKIKMVRIMKLDAKRIVVPSLELLDRCRNTPKLFTSSNLFFRMSFVTIHSYSVFKRFLVIILFHCLCFGVFAQAVFKNPGMPSLETYEITDHIDNT